MDDRDVYCSAKLLIDQYGVDVAVRAAMRVNLMLARGDMEGAAVWKRIVRAIAEVQSTAGRTKH